MDHVFFGSLSYNSLFSRPCYCYTLCNYATPPLKRIVKMFIHGAVIERNR